MAAERFFHPNLETVSQQAIKVVHDLLASNLTTDTFDVSADLYCQQDLIDADLSESVWKDIIPVVACPFLPPPSTLPSATTASTDNVKSGAGSSGLPAANIAESSVTNALRIIVTTIKIAKWYNVAHAVDTLILLLADFSLFIKVRHYFFVLFNLKR
jgi:hypothetical protein